MMLFSNTPFLVPAGPPAGLVFSDWDAFLRLCFASKNKTMRSIFGNKNVVAMLLLGRAEGVAVPPTALPGNTTNSGGCADSGDDADELPIMFSDPCQPLPASPIGATNSGTIRGTSGSTSDSSDVAAAAYALPHAPTPNAFASTSWGPIERGRLDAGRAAVLAVFDACDDADAGIPFHVNYSGGSVSSSTSSAAQSAGSNSGPTTRVAGGGVAAAGNLRSPTSTSTAGSSPPSSLLSGPASGRSLPIDAPTADSGSSSLRPNATPIPTLLALYRGFKAAGYSFAPPSGWAGAPGRGALKQQQQQQQQQPSSSPTVAQSSLASSGLSGGGGTGAPSPLAGAFEEGEGGLHYRLDDADAVSGGGDAAEAVDVVYRK